MEKTIFSIFTGDDKIMYLKAIQGGCAGDPLDLTSCTEIDVSLPNADGTFTHLTKTDDQVVISEPTNLGKFSATIESEVSDLLQPGEGQNFDVTFTIATDQFTVRYFGALSVFERD